MNATLLRAEDGMLPIAASRGHDVHGLRQHADEARRAAPARGLHAVFTRLAAAMERRRAIAELRTLTDRELADIGLQRAEIPYVFARAVAAELAPASRPARSMRAANDVAGTHRAAA